MQLNSFDVLIGLRLSIIRRAADMLGLHFGPIRPHASGEGTVADYALHIQCPWRIDSPGGTFTGRDDLWNTRVPASDHRIGRTTTASVCRIKGSGAYLSVREHTVLGERE